VSRLLQRLGVELPVVQAGMGGGLARAELAAAVSGAGGLGTTLIRFWTQDRCMPGRRSSGSPTSGPRASWCASWSPS
jgi:hypothetical protein